jgi:hypothetical protein
MSRGPDFVVIGAMKSATTTLHVQLNRQSGIFMSDPKEPNFFSDDKIYAQGLDWYYSLFSEASPTDLCGESSTHYTKLPTHPSTVSRLRGVFPRLKLLYVIRHPIDRLVSQFIHDSIQGPVRCSIDLAIDRYPQLIDYSRYSMQLEPFLDAYGAENILIAYSERLARVPQMELERICRFLGYRGEPRWDGLLGRQNARNQRLRPSVVRNILVNAPGLKTIRQRYVPKEWRERIKGIWRVSDQPKPRLSEASERRLREIFDVDLGRLGHWMGIDLSCDRYRDVVLGKPSTGTVHQPPSLRSERIGCQPTE